MAHEVRKHYLDILLSDRALGWHGKGYSFNLQYNNYKSTSIITQTIKKEKSWVNQFNKEDYMKEDKNKGSGSHSQQSKLCWKSCKF